MIISSPCGWQYLCSAFPKHDSATGSVQSSLEIMTEHHIRHLPVVDENGIVLGMVSIGDLVKDVITLQQSTIEQLENYIRT
ncbi:CBS domain-containing protein [Pseudomonadales bacterium]|nr:CBS domain-containing protein [Pseudomonadales bacterium]